MAEGGLHFVVTQDNRQALTSLEQMRRGFANMSQQAQQSGQSMDDTFNHLKNTILGVAGSIASFATIKTLAQQVMNTRGEFQQLEIAFTTMLGSAEKANKLMTQLTTTAAKTPFDLKGIAQGAKQLLAYGTSAEDVNSTIIKLGDIAAGVSVPLNDLVYLYGTTMVQGRMFTQDLRQFQGRGIPIVEALSKTMGVANDAVQELVTNGKIGAEEFQKALFSLVEEGGKFGGLMNEQSKSITGQISNIQDSVDMMFNEIGQSSEGIINTALSGVSKLIENYKSVGTAILALVGTYGTYKASLVIVSAIEKAHVQFLKQAVLEKKLATMANISLSNTDAMAAAREAFFTKTIKLNTKAILKNTAAMLTNPAVLITAGLVALCATIYAVSKALNTQARAQEKLNKLSEEHQAYLDETKSSADQAISTIQSETATIYEKAQAYKRLGEVLPEFTAQYTQAQIATTDLTEAQKDEAQALENLDFEKKRQEIADVERNVQSLQDLINTPYASNAGTFTELKREQTVLKGLKEEYAKMEEVRAKAIADAQKPQSPVDSKTLQQLIKDIFTAENALYTAQKNYAENMTSENKKAVTNAEATLKTLTDDYKTATDTAWADTKKMYEDIATERQKAMNERQKMLNSSIQAERVQREAEYYQQLKEIAQEETQYKKAHNGRTSSEFNLKRENAKIQLDLDVEDFDRKFAEWKRSFEKETLDIKVDTDTSEMENAVDWTITITDKIRKQNELFERQIALKKEANHIDAEDTVRSKYGEKTLSDYRSFTADKGNQTTLTQYHNATTPEGKKQVADTAGLQESLLATYAEMQEIYEQYEARLTATIQQATKEHNRDMLQQDINDYTAYCEEVIKATKERQEAIDAILNGQETNRTADMVENDYKNKLQAIGKNHDIDSTEKEATQIVARLVQSLSDVTYDEVQQVAQEFYDEINKQVDMLQQVRGMSQEDRTTNLQQAQSDLSSLQTQEQDPLLTEEQKLALAEQIAEKEQEIVYLKMTEQELDAQSMKLLSTKQTMEEVVDESTEKAGKKKKEEMLYEQMLTANVSDGLQKVSQSAKMVANTFGGVLSDKAKMALGVIEEVADYGVQMIQSITNISVQSDQLIASTAAGAAESIKTVERASVILAVIGAVLQTMQAIANIFTANSKHAKVNKELDKMADKVKKLKNEQRDLEHESRNDTGSQKWKDQSKLLDNLKKQQQENQQAYETSLAEEERLRNKYGDSKKKTKEQAERTQEFKESAQEAEDAIDEVHKSIMDNILTTDVDSWADGLADSIIEAAKEGSDAFQDIWDNTMEDWERSMYKAQLKTQYQNLFASTFKGFNDRAEALAAKGNIMSEYEIDQFVSEMEAKEAEAQRLADMYRELMEKRGLTEDEEVEGSKGGFENMSQDTADELNARFTALQIEGANVVTATQQIQGLIENIANNDTLRLNSILSMQNNLDLAVMIQQNQLDHLRTIAESVNNIEEHAKRLKNIEQNTDRL